MYAGTDEEKILLAEASTTHLETIRRNWPFLRDRRVDAFAGLTERFLA